MKPSDLINTAFAQRSNLEYIEELYKNYSQNPDSVGGEWKTFFAGIDFAGSYTFGVSEKELNVFNLIQAYRNYGHFEAKVDPLSNTPVPNDQLRLDRFGLSDKDLDTRFQIGSVVGCPNAPLKEIISTLRQAYCGTLTVQCAEALPEVRNWFIREFELQRGQWKLTVAQKKQYLMDLTKAECLEKFIHMRYVGTKRFSIEGGDSVIPMLDHLSEKGTELGVKEVCFGMAHRGRINVLANYMGKPVEYIFADFNGPIELKEKIEEFDGDVKYHLGYQTQRPTQKGPCQVTLAFNPSHLEAVNPVVLGMSRAAQRRYKDTKKRKTVMPLLIHGDAAFASQGIGLETFQMAHVKGYTVGGTLHLVIDNQVGFTTTPENGRSSHYASDPAKVLATPVLHVNGDDVEACVRAMDIAVRFRQEWSRDIVINLVCYRRYGHNEGDEPSFTQPTMYEIIRKHPTTRELYAKQLASENSVSLSDSNLMVKNEMDRLQKIYDETKATPPKMPVFNFDGYWKGLRRAKPEDFSKSTDTKVSKKMIQDIGKIVSSVPANFTPHPKLIKLLENRKAMSTGEQLIDWGMGEILAYGSLLTEGTSVRLTGQDCVRGTFTHRHAALFDQKTDEPYSALDTINDETVEFCVYDSILSEYAVLGFEYGNSIMDPSFLTLWEAQFGDFCNGAQIIIDQFIAAGESKWQQMSGMVLLLPHGYEGQGPEHSSARLERFLQLSAQHNIQVMNLTTPAQIFHALRRQVRRDFRKPLVIMSPKSLLRHPKAVSQISDFTDREFQEVIIDDNIKASDVKKIVFVSGKLYYELLEERDKRKDTSTALVRLEQIYPFPTHKISEVFKTYKNAQKVVWTQEEPRNMGAFQNVFFQFQNFFEKESVNVKFYYAGRPERSSPAVGSLYRHKAEQAELITHTFNI